MRKIEKIADILFFPRVKIVRKVTIYGVKQKKNRQVAQNSVAESLQKESYFLRNVKSYLQIFRMWYNV